MRHWIGGNVIQRMKVKVEHWFLKSDTERKQPYKFVGVHEDYLTGEVYVSFYPLRTEEERSFVLQKDEFLSKFEIVIKEV